MKCKNEMLLAKVGKEKVTKETEIEFTILDPIDSCRRINTRDYVYTDATAGTLTYDRFTIPDDAFNCYGDRCANSGTRTIPATKKVVYRVPYNQADIYIGVITFYAKATGTVTVRVSDSKSMTNADVYEPTYISSTGFTPIVVDLSMTPASTAGTGWTYTKGADVFIEISSSAVIQISTITLFESIEAFTTMNVVKMACLTSIDGAWALELAEQTCVQEGDYDTESPSFEFTVAGKLLTPNFDILNPMHNRGTKTRGWQNASVVKTTKTGKYADKSHITLDDMNQDECGFLSVQVKDYCHTTDAQLVRLNIPVTDNITIDERHYIVIKNCDGTTDIVFNLPAGIDMLVSYPQVATIEHFVGNLNNLVGKTVRMAWPEIMTDGTKYVNVLNNVKVTSFPWNVSNEEGDFEITLQAQRDVNDNFYERQRIVSSVVQDLTA